MNQLSNAAQDERRNNDRGTCNSNVMVREIGEASIERLILLFIFTWSFASIIMCKTISKEVYKNTDYYMNYVE